MPKAVVCRELGPPESLRLETFASAPLGPGEVRVAIHAAGINFPDILMAAGEYQLKPPLPFTPGVEAAGEVTEVNDALSDSPEKINEDPYGDGWLVKVKLSSGEEHESLLTAAEYQKLLDR